MPEDNKPIFPRSTEMSEEKKQELRRKIAVKLENEETDFSASEQKIYCSNCQTTSLVGVKFCRVCGNNLSSSIAPPENEPSEDIHSSMYGPPPMTLENELDDREVSIVYGPPAMYIVEKPTELPITLRDLKIDKDIIPPAPPMELSKLFNNKIVWMVVGIVVGFAIAVVAIGLFIILFLRFR